MSCYDPVTWHILIRCMQMLMPLPWVIFIIKNISWIYCCKWVRHAWKESCPVHNTTICWTLVLNTIHSTGLHAIGKYFILNQGDCTCFLSKNLCTACFSWQTETLWNLLQYLPNGDSEDWMRCCVPAKAGSNTTYTVGNSTPLGPFICMIISCLWYW